MYFYHFISTNFFPLTSNNDRPLNDKMMCFQKHHFKELISSSLFNLFDFVTLKKQKKENFVFGASTYSAELDSSDRVAQLVQRRWPAHNTHHIGHNKQDSPWYAGLSWEAHLKQNHKDLELSIKPIER